MKDILIVDNILRDGSDRVRDLKGAVPAVQTYVDTWVSSLEQGDAALWQLSLRKHPDMVRTLDENIDRTSKILGGVQTKLTDTDKAYRDQKGDMLAEVNKIYAAMGQGSGGSLDESGHRTTFGSTIPRVRDGDPDKPSGIPTAVLEILSGGPNIATIVEYFTKGNFGGVAGMALIACDVYSQMTGEPNPILEAAKYIAGDWDKVGQAGDALRRCGDWYQSLATELREDCGVLFRGWDGPGAERAESYFTALIGCFEQQKEKLSTIGGEYVGLGHGMLLSTSGVLGLMAQLLDIIVAIAISSEVCIALSTTGIGAISWLAVAGEVWAAMSTWAQIAAILTTMWNAGQAFFGWLAGVGASAFPTALVELPAGA